MKQISLLIAGLSVSAVTFAAPVTVAEIDAAFTANTLQQAWLTGATAPTRTVYEGWVRGCDANTNTIFSTQTGSAAVPGAIGNFSAYACTRGGIVSVLYHTLDGGSLNAYTPHTIGTALARVKYVGTGNGCATTGANAPVNYVDNSNPLNNALVHKACTLIGIAVPSSGPTTISNNTTTSALGTDLNAPQWPTGGYSDVEASLFSASIGGGIVSSKGAETNVGVGQVFTVAASIPLYRALQTEQNLPLDDDIANAPNITSGQYANIISTGGTADWSGILPGNTNEVILARRVDTSGTQSSSNAFFLRNPCASGVGQALSPLRAVNSATSTLTVIEGSGTGNVKTALTDATIRGASSDPAISRRSFAIGVMSAENDWRFDPPASSGYRFLKIDGVHPEAGDIVNARASATSGNYKFYMELKQFIRANYVGKPPKTTFESAVIGQITNQLRNPPAPSCATFPRGLALTPENATCTLGVEVARMTNNGQNCATAIHFF